MTERIKLRDNQVWRTRGGEDVLLKQGLRYFESYNPNRPEDKWVFDNGEDGLAGEHERQVFLDPSPDDLVELIREGD